MWYLHDRVPIILPRHAVDHWLDPAVSDAEELKPMLRAFHGVQLQMWPVGRAVGNVRNQGPKLTEPINALEDLTLT
jgi:putative SOS response-associated peptidase YedK